MVHNNELYLISLTLVHYETRLYPNKYLTFQALDFFSLDIRTSLLFEESCKKFAKTYNTYSIFYEELKQLKIPISFTHMLEKTNILNPYEAVRGILNLKRRSTLPFPLSENQKVYSTNHL